VSAHAHHRPNPKLVKPLRPVEPVPAFSVRFTPPCGVCGLPLLKGETRCPRCVREGRR
jgi:hypothetical protein